MILGITQGLISDAGLRGSIAGALILSGLEALGSGLQLALGEGHLL